MGPVAMQTFHVALFLCVAVCSSLNAGASLSLIPCETSDVSLVTYQSGTRTLRSSDGGQCATFVGASPAQLVMQPCASLASQSWVFNATKSIVEQASGGLCLNSQGDTATPARPISTWPCSDLDWNSFFWVRSDGKVQANCTTPSTCGPSAPAYCVGSKLGRTLTLATVVRYWTVETTREEHLLNNESSIHTVANCKAYRDAVTAGWPGATVTWAFSWVALHTQEGEYPAIRALVVSYISSLGDEMTFIPGGYFAPMYNNETQTNADIHDALSTIGSIAGSGYRPKAILGGYLGAQTLAYLARVEDIHVAQATIFSQYNIDFGDGDGGSPYPYYPSTEHYLKPAQGAGDFVDLVAMDGWTVDFMNARRNGFAEGFNSRMGVGPIETIRNLGPEKGFIEQMHATSQHFDTGMLLNGEAFVTSIWEISLAPVINVSYLTQWLSAVRAQWPDAQAMTHGAYGLQWRAQHCTNDYNYSWVVIGSGIAGSDADKELTFYATRAFRLVLLRNLADPPGAPGPVVDFTRYDLPAAEPPAGNLTRSWNLMNEVNWKNDRKGGVDTPRPLAALSQADRDLIHAWLPGLV